MLSRWITLSMALAATVGTGAITAEAVQIHEQRSNPNQLLFKLPVSEEANGIITVSEGMVWIDGEVYELPAFSHEVGDAPFYLWIEKTETGADYLLDFVKEEEPVPFSEDVGPVLIAWRDTPGTEINVLRSTQ
jgi:hypothetical protein